MSDNSQRGRSRGSKRRRDESTNSTEDYTGPTEARRSRAGTEQNLLSMRTSNTLRSQFLLDLNNGTTLASTPVRMNIDSPAAVAERMSEESPNTAIVWTAVRLDRPRPSNMNPENRRLILAQERDIRGARGPYRGRLGVNSPRPSQPAEPKKPCKICSGKHRGAQCIDLRAAEINDTMTGLRLWCPFHNAPHTIKECRQKWLWLQDPDKVHSLLITRSANAPAFATDLVSWPDIVRDTDKAFPWSATHTARQWTANRDSWKEEQANGVITSNLGPDPSTASRDDLSHLPHQTLSGNPPIFQGPGALVELAAHAVQMAKAYKIAEEAEARKKSVEAAAQRLRAKN
ncbi:hypothetical protein F4802DRAFT_542070 [Xylaria palmicola]|nr:hypothetical protein F4802DRAFT_542070 [Xylaria palmicola]